MARTRQAAAKSTLFEVLDQMGWPDAVTMPQLVDMAPWLTANRTRQINLAAKLRHQGYKRVRGAATHGLWEVCGGSFAIYARTDMAPEHQWLAAQRLAVTYHHQKPRLGGV